MQTRTTRTIVAAAAFSAAILLQSGIAHAQAIDPAALAALNKNLAAVAAALQAQTAKTAPAPVASAPKTPARVNGNLDQRVQDLEAMVAVLQERNTNSDESAFPVYLSGFPSASAELSQHQKRQLDAVVRVINDTKPSGVDAIGYASGGGDPDKNKEVAGERANKVVAYINAQLIKTAAPVTVASAPGTPTPAPTPTVAPDKVQAYTGGETAQFSLRLGPQVSNQGVLVRFLK